MPSYKTYSGDNRKQRKMSRRSVFQFNKYEAKKELIKARKEAKAKAEAVVKA